MPYLSQSQKNYRFFFDIGSLTRENALVFYDQILPNWLAQTQSKMILPYWEIRELEKMTGYYQNRKGKIARDILSVLHRHFNNGFIDVRGSEADGAIPDFFEKIFERFMGSYDLSMITQDRDLARKVLKLKQKYQGSKSITVFSLKGNRNGNFNDWLEDWEDILSGGSARNGRLFSLCTSLVQTKDAVVPVSMIPKKGDMVITSGNGKMRLGVEIGNGGEGTIYHAENGLVCKVYKKNSLTEHKLKKLTLMIGNPINHSGICWPRHLAYNTRNEFVGYAMSKGEGKPIPSLVFDRGAMLKCFPNWSKKNIIELSLSILERIDQLHQRNVMIGDFNPRNILVRNQHEVFFVDSDSYQIEDYPCPVGTEYFDAPEIQGKEYRTFLRTFDHENFAVATLLFMILLSGKAPYSIKGGGTPEENIKRMDFPYPLDGKRNNRVPDGPWIYLWDHLPFFMKDAFYDTFRNNTRKNVQEWLLLLKRYKDAVELGRASDALFPRTTYVRKTNKVICFLCNKQFSEGEGYVKEANQAKPNYVCPMCGQRFKKQGGGQLPRPRRKRKARPVPQQGTSAPPVYGNDLLSQFFRIIFS